MTTLDVVSGALAGSRLDVRRAWPRSPEHLLLDLVDRRSGRSVAGQWFADRDRAQQVADATGPPARVFGGLVLQPGGADRRLPGLAPLLRSSTAALIAHRPERRAVVRRADGCFTKVLRPGRTAAVASAARLAAGTGLRVPTVVDVDDAAGTVTTAPLAGQTLHDLLAAASPACVPAAGEAGRALAVLHASPLPLGAAVHDAPAEAGVLQRWWDFATAHGLLEDELDPSALAALAAPSERLVPVHRDLHDKQILVDERGEVGFLDFDLAAAGEPALDLANLLVHLDLRARQATTDPGLAADCSTALLAGYDPSPAVRARLAVYGKATRLRLVAVCAFRPDEPLDAAFGHPPEALLPSH